MFRVGGTPHPGHPLDTGLRRYDGKTTLPYLELLTKTEQLLQSPAHIDIIQLRHHDVYMRTTLTLDADVADFLNEQARLLGKPFKQVVNDTLRRGMSPSIQEAPRLKYRVTPIDSEFLPGVDQMRLKDLLEEEDIEHFLKKSRM